MERVKLSLRSRLAAAYREFVDARDLANRYKTVMLPRAETAYDLYMTRFRQMAAAYPQAPSLSERCFNFRTTTAMFSRACGRNGERFRECFWRVR